MVERNSAGGEVAHEDQGGRVRGVGVGVASRVASPRDLPTIRRRHFQAHDIGQEKKKQHA